MPFWKVKPARDPAYRALVRGQRCALGTWRGDCDGPIEAAHLPPRGEGRKGAKSSDYYCGPLCQKHHRMQHNGQLHPEEIIEAQLYARRVLVQYLDQNANGLGSDQTKVA